ncbi:MAG TPA: zinc ribbon domain-containing protein [Acidimicrobiia bacterium]|nr:zinc ribbon domain-containing protein [Acidimicrobiia bacterium]
MAQINAANASPASRIPEATEPAVHPSACLTANNTTTVAQYPPGVNPPGGGVLARHVCDNCGSVVSDDDQFCPSCGSWIDPTSGANDEGDEYEEFSLDDAPPPTERTRPPVQVASQTVSCPSCGAPNPDTNRHCEECGARLSQGALPVAPRPAVQATAGVRAAMAISGLLFGVVLIALLFNIFTGDDEDPDTIGGDTTSTTATTIARVPEPIDILSADCSISGLSGFECRNLIDPEREYQISWEELGETDIVTIDLIFPEPMVVTGFVWENLPADTDRFYQNYRARSISLSTDAAGAPPLGHELDDEPGKQAVEYVSLRTLSLRIQINTVYLPEERNGRVFTELAIRGIEVVGYPAGDVGTTTSTVTETTAGG